MSSGVGTMSYLILIFRAITFSKMTKSYHVYILEPSYIEIFPWAINDVWNGIMQKFIPNLFRMALTRATLFMHTIMWSILEKCGRYQLSQDLPPYPMSWGIMAHESISSNGWGWLVRLPNHINDIIVTMETQVAICELQSAVPHLQW